MFSSKFYALIAALWLALCAPVLAVPGTPVNLGGTPNNADGTCNIVTSGSVTAGSTVVMALIPGSGAVVPTLSQFSIGGVHPNGLQALPTTAGATSRDITLAWWFNRSDASGTTIAYSDGSGTSNQACQAWYITGVNSVDVTVKSLDFTATTTPSIASGTLANSSEILLGYVMRGAVANATAPGAPWTTMPSYGTPGSFSGGSTMSYDIVSVTTTVTYNPTFSGSERGSIGIVSFYQGAAAGAKSRSLLGVGQ